MIQNGNSTKSIRETILKLGLSESKKLIFDFASEDLFESKSELLNIRMHTLYDVSIDVASIGCALSKESGLLIAENVWLAGLMHEIAVMPILYYIEKTGMLITNEQELEGIILK